MFFKEEKNNFQYLFLSSSWQVFFTSGAWETEAEKMSELEQLRQEAEQLRNQIRVRIVNCLFSVIKFLLGGNKLKRSINCSCLTRAELKIFSEYLKKIRKTIGIMKWIGSISWTKCCISCWSLLSFGARAVCVSASFMFWVFKNRREQWTSRT